MHWTNCDLLALSRGSQFLIGKVERKNLVHDNDSSVSRTTSQFLIGKVEHLNMKIPIHTVLLSQFLIGKV